MCIHDRVDIRNSLRGLQGNDAWGVMWFESPDGRVYGMDCIDFRDGQAVADCIRNVREWHPEVSQGNWALHMEDVNIKRTIYKLPWLTEENLPQPKGKAPPSRDRAAAASA